MKALGGKAVRAWRQDSAEEFFEKHADAWKAQLQERGAERAAAKVARTKSGLDAEIARAEEAVRKSAATALKRLDDTRVELRARLAALAEQSRTATPAVRSRIDQRMAELRADFGERERTLLRAYASGEDAVGGEGTSRVESVHE
jgi:transketolase